MSSSTTSRCGALHVQARKGWRGHKHNRPPGERVSGIVSVVVQPPIRNKPLQKASNPDTRMKPHSAKLSVMLKTKTEDRRWSAV
jgi:hypothetical protein